MKKWVIILILMTVLGICGSCGGSSAEITSDERQTSTSIETQNVAEATVQSEIPVPAIGPEENPPEITYILNTSSRKFHKPSCRSVELMKPENARETSASRDEVLEIGYTPCGNCRP